MKDAAVDGALAAGTEGVRVRTIGILPRETLGAEITRPRPDTCCLLVRTALTSHQRNRLTGGLPAAVVALPGGAGTLSEIGFACQAGRPVIFLDSFDLLREEFNKEDNKRELDKILREVQEVYPDTSPTGVLDCLKSLFEGQRAQHRAVDPVEAVELALGAIAQNAAGLKTRAREFVGVEGRTVSADHFDQQFLCLIQ